LWTERAYPVSCTTPDALPQRDPRLGPARNRCPIGRHRDLEVVHASDVLDNAVGCVVPNIDAEGKMRLGLHRGKFRLDLPWPVVIYTPIMLLRRVAFPDRLRYRRSDDRDGREHRPIL